MPPHYTWVSISFAFAAVHQLLFYACSAALHHVVEHRAELGGLARLARGIYLRLAEGVYDVIWCDTEL